MRIKAIGVDKPPMTTEEKENASEVVLDLGEVPFVGTRIMETAVMKLKMSDDHSKAAFTLDVGNTEQLTAGVKDMETNTVSNLRLENVC